MTEIATRNQGELANRPVGARQLGARVKPIIRLGMGIKDPERGFPKKTDHFTVRGDERAVAKFQKVYGDAPKAVKIMVPSELSLALDISYRSFVGGGEDGDGRPLALGMTNFSPLGYVGGPDVLRVWRQDGSYAEVETAGLDELGKPLDEIANDLKIEVHTTFYFTIPEVLGWGSFAAITSKGKKTADNLTFKLTEIYSAFGTKAPFAFDKDEPPRLVLKPDTAMMRFEDKAGKAKWGKTNIFVLDIVIPEAFNDMVERLAQRQAEIAPHGPIAAVYGDDRRALEPGPGTSVSDDDAGPEDEAPSQAEAATSPQTDTASAASSEEAEPVEGEVVDEGAKFAPPAGTGSEDDPDVVAANAAAGAFFPKGKHKGKTIREAADLGDDGVAYIRYVAVSWDIDEFVDAAFDFLRVYAPDAYEFAKAKRETAE